MSLFLTNEKQPSSFHCLSSPSHFLLTLLPVNIDMLRAGAESPRASNDFGVDFDKPARHGMLYEDMLLLYRTIMCVHQSR